MGKLFRSIESVFCRGRPFLGESFPLTSYYEHIPSHRLIIAPVEHAAKKEQTQQQLPFCMLNIMKIPNCLPQLGLLCSICGKVTFHFYAKVTAICRHHTSHPCAAYKNLDSPSQARWNHFRNHKGLPKYCHIQGELTPLILVLFSLATEGYGSTITPDLMQD